MAKEPPRFYHGNDGRNGGCLRVDLLEQRNPNEKTPQVSVELTDHLFRKEVVEVAFRAGQRVNEGAHLDWRTAVHGRLD